MIPPAYSRLQTLTRDYARLTRSGAGLGKVLGGCFLWVVAGVDLAGHGWRFALLGGWAPLGDGAALTLGLLPFLWLGAREALAKGWYRRHGTVEEAPAQGPKVLGGIVLPVLLLGGMAPLLLHPVPMRGPRLALVAALAAGLALAWRRFRDRDRLERLVGILLFAGPAFLVSGLRMASGDVLVAFPLAGAAAVAAGLREHVAYRRLERELAGGL